MTDAVTPPAAPTVPQYPQLGAPNFNALAYTYGSTMPTVTAGIKALADNAFVNATASSEKAATAVSASLAAEDASEIALGAANFKGLWSSLTGALNKPAAVKHNGRFWLLLNNLANVTTSQPGVSADWTSLDAGTPITQVITGNTVAIVGVTYLIAGALTLTLPTTGLNKGDAIGWRLLVSPSPSILIDFGSVKYRGQTVSGGTTYIDIRGFAENLNYEDATYGWV